MPNLKFVDRFTCGDKVELARDLRTRDTEIDDDGVFDTRLWLKGHRCTVCGMHVHERDLTYILIPDNYPDITLDEVPEFYIDQVTYTSYRATTSKGGIVWKR